MRSKKLDKRLQMLNEARSKVSKIKKMNVFSMDLGALRILEDLTKEFQEILSENLKLEEENKLLKLLKTKRKSD